MHKLKSMFLSQLALLSNNLVLTSYLSGIYLESWFSWLWGGVQKTSKKEENRQKKNEKYGESYITTICVFGFKLYFVGKCNLKKSCLYHQILFSFYALQDIRNTVLIQQI